MEFSVKNIKLIKNGWYSILFVLMAHSVCMGQQKRIIKAEAALNQSDFRKALRLSEKAIKHKETSRNPLPYIIKSKALYALSKDGVFLNKEPKAFNLAVKAGAAAVLKDKKKEVVPLHEDFISELAVENNKSALGHFNKGKFAKAQSEFKLSQRLNRDTFAMYMLGKIALELADTASAHEIFREVINLQYETWKETRKSIRGNPEPFLALSKHFMNKGWVDSAGHFMEMARHVYGGDERLDSLHYQIILSELAFNSPSYNFLESLRNNLYWFPTDSLLIHKENAMTLYLINSFIKLGNIELADSMIDYFVDQKVERTRSIYRDEFYRADKFLSYSKDTVLWELTRYYFLYRHDKSAGYIAGRFVESTKNTSQGKNLQGASLSRWIELIKESFKNRSLGFTHMLLVNAEQKFPHNTELLALRKSITNEAPKKNLSVNEKITLFSMLERAIVVFPKEPAYKKQSMDLNLKLITELTDSGMFSMAFQFYRKAVKNHPGLKELPALNKKLVSKDFATNYYGTRIVNDTVNGKSVPGFVWDGEVAKCKPGQVSDKIQEKVQRRINFFRRLAGVPDNIFLDPVLNQQCQLAALMMQANNNMSHNPTKNWKCYNEKGVDAAKLSLLTKGTVNTLAVTAFMGDDHPSVGNRRWLLNPSGQRFGHGSTSNFSAIWAIDDSGVKDSAHYSQNFVAWPPEGYVPSMLTFNRWSFSLFANLSKAVVSMTNSKGQNIPLVQEPLVPGYGMSTIVWKPELDVKSITAEETYFVTVSNVAGNREFKYRVVVFPMNLN